MFGKKTLECSFVVQNDQRFLNVNCNFSTKMLIYAQQPSGIKKSQK
jgi:hypothetical protein